MCGSILKRNTIVYRKNTTEEDVATVELLDIIQNTDNNNELMYSELFIDNDEKESIPHLICVSLGLSVFFIIIFNIIKHL